MVNRPLVFLPGYYGSKFRLKSSNEVVWVDLDDIFRPGRVMSLLRLDQDPDPVYVDDILDAIDLRPFFCVSIYKKLKRFLRKSLHYPLEMIHGHAIDWRQSLDWSADRLHAALQAPAFKNQKIDLLCHSHGGLVARAYLSKYGPNKVARCITLGTPHHGMLAVLMALSQGIDLATFTKDLTKPAARTMPSAFELLPRFPRHGLFTWNGKASDPFNQKDWTIHEADPPTRALLDTALEKAKKVTETLLPDQIDVPAYFLYGTRLNTATNAKGDDQTPLEFTRTDDGDSTVTTLSAEGRGINGQITRCPAPFAVHMTLFNDPYVRKLLKNILLRNNLPGGNFQVSARWQNQFYFPGTRHSISVEVRDDRGEPLPNTQVHLKLYHPKQPRQPVLQLNLPQTSRGDFYSKIVLPQSEKPLRYRIKISNPTLPKKLTTYRGILHPR